MTYAAKGDRVFRLQDPTHPDCTPEIRRSDHRLKRFESTSDKRAWDFWEEPRATYLRDLMSGSQTCIAISDGTHKYVPLEDLIRILMADKDAKIKELEDRLRRLKGGERGKGRGKFDERFADDKGKVGTSQGPQRIENVIEERDRTRAMLREAMNKLQNIDVIVNENKSLQGRLKCSEERVKLLEEKKKNLEKELADLRSQSQIQVDLEKAQKMLSDVKQKHERSAGMEEAVLHSLSLERDELQEKVKMLEKELEESRKKEEEIEMLKKKSESDSLDREEIARENECYKRKLASMKCLEKQIQELKREGRALADKYRKEAQRAKDQLNRMAQAANELQCLREERDALRKRVNELAAYEDQYNKLQKKLQRVDAVIAENENLNAKLNELHNLEKENENLKRRLEQLREYEMNAAEDKERIMQLQCAVADQEEEMKDLLCQIERLTSGRIDEELDRLRCELSEKSSKLRLCEEQLAEIPMLEAEIDELRMKLQTCCKEFPEKKKSENRHQTLIVRLPSASKSIHVDYKTPEEKFRTRNGPCTGERMKKAISDCKELMSCDDVQNLLQKSKGIISCVLEDMNKHQKEMEELELRNKNMKEEIEMLKEIIADPDKSSLLKKIYELKKDLDEKDKQIWRLLRNEEDIAASKALREKIKSELKDGELPQEDREKTEEPKKAPSEESRKLSELSEEECCKYLRKKTEDLKLQIKALNKLTEQLKEENKLLRELQKPCPDFSKELDEKCALENLLSLLQAELDAFKGQKLSDECEALRNELKRVLEQNCQLKALVNCYKERLHLEKQTSELAQEKFEKPEKEKEIVGVSSKKPSLAELGKPKPTAEEELLRGMPQKAYLEAPEVLPAHEGIKEEERPGQERPGQEIPGQERPGLERPGQERPGQEIPGQERPGQERPGQEIPGQERPGQERPGQEIPGQERPGQERPGQERPGQERLGQEIPGQERPGQEIPGQERPGQERPGQERPGQERPGQEIPGQERPGQERPDKTPDYEKPVAQEGKDKKPRPEAKKFEDFKIEEHVFITPKPMDSDERTELQESFGLSTPKEYKPAQTPERLERMETYKKPPYVAVLEQKAKETKEEKRPEEKPVAEDVARVQRYGEPKEEEKPAEKPKLEDLLRAQGLAEPKEEEKPGEKPKLVDLIRAQELAESKEEERPVEEAKLEDLLRPLPLSELGDEREFEEKAKLEDLAKAKELEAAKREEKPDEKAIPEDVARAQQYRVPKEEEEPKEKGKPEDFRWRALELEEPEQEPETKPKLEDLAKLAAPTDERRPEEKPKPEDLGTAQRLATPKEEEGLKEKPRLGDLARAQEPVTSIDSETREPKDITKPIAGQPRPDQKTATAAEEGKEPKKGMTPDEELQFLRGEVKRLQEENNKLKKLLADVGIEISDGKTGQLAIEGLEFARRAPGEAAGKAPGEAVGRAPGEAAGRVSGEAAERAPGEGARRAPGEAAGRAPGEAAGRAPGEAVGRAPGEAAGRAPGEVAGRAPGEAAGRAPGEAVGRAPGEAAGRASVEAAEGAPGEAARRARREAPGRPSAEGAEEAPGEAAGRARREAPGRAPGEAVGRASVEAAEGAPGEAAGRAPGEAAGRAPGEAAGRAPGEAAGRAPGEAVGRAPGEAAGRAPGEAVRRAPGEAAGRASVEAAEGAPGEAAGRARREAPGRPSAEGAEEAPGEGAGRAPGQAARRAPGEAARRAPGEAAGRPSADTAGRASAEAAGRAPGEAAGRARREAPGRAPGEAAGRAPGEAAGRARREAPGRPSVEAAEEALGEAAGRAPGQAGGRAPGQAAGRAAGQAAGRAAGQAARRAPGETAGKALEEGEETVSEEEISREEALAQLEESKARLASIESENADKIKKLQAQHEKELSEIERAYNESVSALKSSYEGDIRKMADRHKSSVMRLQELHEDEVKDISSTHESQMGTMQSETQAALMDVAKGTAAKMKKLAEDHSRELKALKAELKKSQLELSELKKGQGQSVSGDLERRARHLREMQKMRMTSRQKIGAIKERMDDERRRSSAEIEALKKQLKGQESEEGVCTCKFARRAGAKPRDPSQALDFNEVLEKILEEGMDSLTFNEIVLVHRKACCALQGIVMRYKQGPPLLELEPAVDEPCPHAPLLDADKQQLLSRIFALETEITRKQKQTQEAILGMELAIKKERCRLLDVKNLLQNEQRKNSKLELLISSQTQFHSALQRERDELGSQVSFNQSLCEEKSKQLEEEIKSKRCLEIEVEKLKGKLKQLCMAIDLERGSFNSQQRDKFEMMRMRMEEAIQNERKLGMQLERETKCRLHMQRQLQALRESLKHMVNLPEPNNSIQIAAPEDKSDKERRNLDQINQTKSKIKATKPTKKHKK